MDLLVTFPEPVYDMGAPGFDFVTAGIPFSVSPNKQCAGEKWEPKQAGEPQKCSHHTEYVTVRFFLWSFVWVDS